MILQLPVGVINQDTGSLGVSLATLLKGSEVIRPVLFDEAEAAQASQMVEDGKLGAVVMIPAGYTAKLLADQTIVLEVIANPNPPAGQTACHPLETTTSRLLGAVNQFISAQMPTVRNGTMDASAREAYVQERLPQAISAWEEPALTVAVEKATGSAPQDEKAAFTQRFCPGFPWNDGAVFHLWLNYLGNGTRVGAEIPYFAAPDE